MDNNTNSSIKDFIKRVLSNNGQSWTIGKIVKITVLIIVALFALSLVLAMFKWVFGIGNNDYRNNNFSLQRVVESPEILLDFVGGEEGYFDDAYQGDYKESYGSNTLSVSSRGVSTKMMAPSFDGGEMILGDSMPYPSEPASKNAEDFETREYSANFEERNIESTCNEFEALKPLEYIVFENANKGETHCSYRFKVEQDRETEVIVLIKSLDPENFNENTFTLERSITNNESEVAILENKMKMFDALLASAQAKYAKLRTTGDTSALVMAINNEINLIERITNQKLNIQSRIDRLTNSGASQKERIDYSQFNISVSERKFINWENIASEWKYAFERFIGEISGAVQDLTIGLVLFVFKLVKFVLFIGIGVVVLVGSAKFVYATSKKIWKKG